MKTVTFVLLHALRSCFRTRLALQAENVALRHQITVLQRGRKRLPLNAADRFLWVCLSRLWVGWRSALAIFKPETVIRWHRKGFRLYWTWKSRRGQPGRPALAKESRELIRKMSLANPLWGAPRIHGELLKLGIDLSQATVARYMVRTRRPPSQTWRAFLNNHVTQLVATDFFAVPTVTFRVLFVFVVLAHDRRRVVHFNVSASPTSEWTARQIAEAFPWDTAPRYLLHDRDSIYGDVFRQRVRGMAIRELLTAPRSPWQNPYVERLIGSIRRECLDHLILFDESSLRCTLKSYFDYYHGARTHLSLEKDAPETRRVQPPELGSVVELPEVGGLHHRYERRAA
ncbi:MAG TPA: integrase core domain-containing protein [Terriglobia bacterium]|nr:integrase core domain-containing protein [Terriglobia bacterium]